VAYSVLLGVALLAPTSGTQSGMAGWITYGWLDQQRAEFVCNALIVAPVSALGSLVWPRTRWQDWTAWTFIGAGLVELTQGLLLPERTASYADVVANTLGALLGAFVVLGSRALRRRG
jgi:glycopeptide antibiotics resistance protein